MVIGENNGIWKLYSENYKKVSIYKDIVDMKVFVFNLVDIYLIKYFRIK